MNKRIELNDGWYVETWYDKHTKNWISQLKDNNGFQIGDAEYDGTSLSVTISQKKLVDQFNTMTGKMTAESATVNSVQILEKLRDNFPDTLEKILEDIDLADSQFVEMLKILSTPAPVK